MTIDISPDLILGMLIADYEREIAAADDPNYVMTQIDQATVSPPIGDARFFEYAQLFLNNAIDQLPDCFEWTTETNQLVTVYTVMNEHEGYLESQLAIYFAQRYNDAINNYTD